MDNGEVIKINPHDFSQMIVSGQIRVTETASNISALEEQLRRDPIVIKAESLFGDDFLGIEAIKTMEEKCRALGIDIKIEIPNIRFPYSVEQLEQAKMDEQKGKARMLILRPTSMIVDDVVQPITIDNLCSLFKDRNPFGTGKLFRFENWGTHIKTPFRESFAMPTKGVVPDSIDRFWEDQERLRLVGERRRNSVEAFWDILLFYANTGRKLLETRYDFTQSLWYNTTDNANHVAVGMFTEEGVHFASSQYSPSSVIGVCFAR